MTDHYESARARLLRVEELRDELLQEYDDPSRRRRDVIAQLHQDIGREMKLGQIEAQLSQAQALHELHSLIDERLATPDRPFVGVSIPGTVDAEAARVLEQHLAHRQRVSGR